MSDLRQSLRRRPGRAVHLDETGFERAAHRPYAWAPKGRKVFGERSGRSRPRTNLIAATAKGKRLFAPLLFEGSLDSFVFNQYLKDQLLKELQPGSLIIMDNAAFHKTQKTRGSLRKADTNSSFCLPILQISTPLRNTSQTSKKSGLGSRRTLPLTTLFDCTVFNGFYYNVGFYYNLLYQRMSSISCTSH